jgi:hypothetical protein
MPRQSEPAETLLVPQGSPPSSVRTTPRELPTDLQQQAAGRLRALALLYAFVFFMAGFFPGLIIAANRTILFGDVLNWLPGVLAITCALVVAAFVWRPGLSPTTLATLAAVFEVVSSYGIGTAEFFQPGGLTMQGNWMGLSWVAVWIPLFTIIVPTSPRRALAAAIAAATAVPVMVAVSLRLFPSPFSISAFNFFFMFVFPYALVVLMAYVGSRVVFALGTEVRRARELGSYRLVARLGAGGMGEVWRAKHRLLARPAAIKLIRPLGSAGGTDDAAAGGQVPETARRRFEREAQVTASLRSPHTVNLFDFGVADDGSFYYVMELLEGLDTERLVNRFGPQPAERVIHILRQMCHSMSEAESIRLVHRDIKPGNIFLCHYGEDYDFVKVLDFGIAKAVQDSDAFEPSITALTVQHVVQGTPAFIAPEQAMGASDIDGRADIYAAGCVAYWLLTGELVFTADTPMKLMMHHAKTEPQPPSARTEVDVPPMLDQVILECLAKDPADRPQTARELAARLGQIACDPWTDERARQWWMIHYPEA